MAQSLERHSTDQISRKAIKLCDDLRRWMLSPNVPFTTQYGYVPGLDTGMSLSPGLDSHAPSEEGNITLIQQFYIASDPRRHKENVQCLRFNIKNPHIDQIVLLNEREYSAQELGVEDLGIRGMKLTQVIVGHRLTYTDAFLYAQAQLRGFVVLANSDIFFDATLGNVLRSRLKEKRRVFCQLRYEYNSQTDLSKCQPLGIENNFRAQPNSQDTWIWHSSHTLDPTLEKIFDVALGTPGCDNAIAHRFGVAGFERLNAPAWIRTYHNHASELRNHHKPGGANTKCSRPYHMIIPSYVGSCMLKRVPPSSRSFDSVQGNVFLREMLENFLKTDTAFLLPRVAGIENDIAALGAELDQNRLLPPDRQEVLNKGIPRLKKHAGVLLSTNKEVIQYSKQYLRALRDSDAYFFWEPWGNVARHYALSFTFVETNFTQKRLSAKVLDVFDLLWCEPWTRALRGKRILIVSAFADTIKSQLENQSNVYPVELFPECTFVFVKPPVTQGGNKANPFAEELRDVVDHIQLIKDSFDVALCSCGGYGNPLCSAIYDMGKSAIYVGGVLQMYFGILGTRWEKERPEIIASYRNDSWVRPSMKERPRDHKSIENACYW